MTAYRIFDEIGSWLRKFFSLWGAESTAQDFPQKYHFLRLLYHLVLYASTKAYTQAWAGELDDIRKDIWKLAEEAGAKTKLPGGFRGASDSVGNPPWSQPS